MTDKQLVSDGSSHSETKAGRHLVAGRLSQNKNESDDLTSCLDVECFESAYCSSEFELQSSCASGCNEISSCNSRADSYSDADTIDLNGQLASAPFGFPLCLKLIETSALSVLENNAVEVDVQHDSVINAIKCSNSSEPKVLVSACQFVSTKKPKKPGDVDCEDCDGRQAELCQRTNTLKKKHSVNVTPKRPNENVHISSNFTNGIESTESDSLNKNLNKIESSSSAVNIAPGSESVSTFLGNGELEKGHRSSNIANSHVVNINGKLDNVADDDLHRVSMSANGKKDTSMSKSDAIDDAEWKSVEARRKKKDVLNKSRELPVVESKTVWSANKVPVSTVSDILLQRPNSVSNRLSAVHKTKVKVEPGSSVMTAGLNLDSSSFPELPTLCYRTSVGTHVGIEPQTGETYSNVSDSEHVRPQRHGVNGLPVGTILDSNSYASVLIGKSKSLTSISTSSSSSNTTNKPVTVYDIEANSSCWQELTVKNRTDGESCRSASSPKFSAELYKMDVDAVGADCGKLVHSTMSTSTSYANCDTESCSAFSIPCNKSASSFISFGDVQLFPGDTISGSFFRTLMTESTACGPIQVDQSGSTAKNDASSSYVIKSSSILSNKLKSPTVFFDTRLKKMPSSVFHLPYDVVFGFDPMLPMTEPNVVEDTCELSCDMPDLSTLCVVEKSLPIKDAEQHLHKNGSTSAAAISSRFNRFNLKSVQAYLNTAFNEVKASRESNPGKILYYGVDIK